MQKKYREFYNAGIRGIFFKADSEKHFRAAKAQKLEAHRWLWIMNRGEKELLQAHPEWYARNRKGESCADKPPYVDYYRWLFPGRKFSNTCRPTYATFSGKTTSMAFTWITCVFATLFYRLICGLNTR